MIVAFVDPDHERSARVAENVDRLVRDSRKQGKNLRGCVVFLGGADLVPRLEELAAARNIDVPLLYMEPRRSPSYLMISPLVYNTVVLIRDHKSYRAFSNVGTAFTRVTRATDALLNEATERVSEREHPRRGS